MNYVLKEIKRTITVAFICILFLIAPAQAATWHVSQHVTSGTGVGDSWPNAMASLTDAFSLAVSGDTILVGQGIYHPEINQSFTIDFNLDQLKLIGGYAGWLPDGVLAADPDLRDVQANQTILSGDLDEDDGLFTGDLAYMRNDTFDDNADTVVTVSNVTDGTRIEGFFIERAAVGVRGGGMFIDESEMDVVNCTFRYNTTGIPFEVPEDPPWSDPGKTSDGVGATVRGGQVVMGEVQYTRFINCTFHDNIAARGGGLAVVNISLEDSMVQVINCQFYNNRSIEMSMSVLKPGESNDRLVLLPMERQSP